MSLRDKSLESKINKQAAKTARKIAQSDPKASMAVRTSNSVVGTKLLADQQILDILKLVEGEAIKGRYIVATKILPAALPPIAKYFKGKGYIVATNDKKNVLVICWMGGSIWRKLEYGTNKIDEMIQNKIYEAITSSVSTNLISIEPTTKSTIGLAPNGNWNAYNLKRIWSKFK